MDREEDKIKRYLSPSTFAWVIKDSFPHRKLAACIEKIGIVYPGVRTMSVSHPQLAEDLAEEAFKDSELVCFLVEELNKLNYSEIKKINSLSSQSLRTYLGKNILSFWEEKRVGKILWAMLVDERREVNEQIPYFIEMVEKAGEVIEESALRDTIEELVVKEGPKLYRDALRALNELKQKYKALEKINREKDKRENSLFQKIEILRKKNKELEKVNGLLAQEKGELKIMIRKKDKEIERLEKELKKEKERTKTSPKRVLQVSLRQWVRNYRKLNHQLEEERKRYRKDKEDFERMTISLKRELADSLERERVLQEKLRSLEAKADALEQKIASEEEKRRITPSSYLHQGRRVGIFIDVQNIYYGAKKYFNKKVDYSKLLDLLVGNRHLVNAICYIVQHPELNQEGFINMLKRKNYTVKIRDLILRADGSAKGNWDIGIALDILHMIEKNRLDIVVLVTCDGDFVDLIKVLKLKKIKVEVAGFPKGTALDLKRLSDEFIPLEEDVMLEESQKS